MKSYTVQFTANNYMVFCDGELLLEDLTHLEAVNLVNKLTEVKE